MLEVFNHKRERTAILQNAFNAKEEERLNEIGVLTFSMPENDSKNSFCEPYAFVRWNGGDFYRIIADSTSRRDAMGVRNYTCEHCIATLADDLMFSTRTIGSSSITTRAVIETILSQQKRGAGANESWWALDECDFDHRHQYIFESETVYSALWAVTEPFPEPHVWRYNFDTFPWRISLKLIETAAAPEFYIRAGKNLLTEDSANDAYEVCTRLYALGNGEGVNQVRIASVNNGKDYIESPPEYIAKYGRIDRLFVDKRYESPAILLAAAKAMLKELQEPKYTRRFSIVDLEKLTNDNLDAARVGKIVRLTDDNTSTYVTAITRNHDIAGDMQIELSNRFTSLADMLTNLANKQRIEMLYGQGATIVYGESLQTNADTSKAATLKIMAPKEMKYINKVFANITLEPYRRDSKMAAAGGGSSTSSGPSGAIPERTPTSKKGRGPIKTSASGGLNSVQFLLSETSRYVTSSTSDGHSHTVLCPITYYKIDGVSNGTVTVAKDHQHTVDINDHDHDTTIPPTDNHTHTTTTPAHEHAIQNGIVESGNPKNGKVLINGVQRTAFYEKTSLELSEYLKDANGVIPRDQWIRVGVLPDDVAYVTIDVMIQGFVQSRGGGTY